MKKITISESDERRSAPRRRAPRGRTAGPAVVVSCPAVRAVHTIIPARGPQRYRVWTACVRGARREEVHTAVFRISARPFRCHLQAVRPPAQPIRPRSRLPPPHRLPADPAPYRWYTNLWPYRFQSPIERDRDRARRTSEYRGHTGAHRSFRQVANRYVRPRSRRSPWSLDVPRYRLL